MKCIKLYQCIPAYKPTATVRLIKFLLAIDCKILLDIEDSIQDVQNPELTRALKVKARFDFMEIVKSLPNNKFSLRINSIRGNEFQNDISLLQDFENSIESVFMPKVETSAEINMFYAAVSTKHKLNLIIETQKGVNNIDEILGSKYMHRFENIFFGNYDYHLDTNTFPITEQHDLRYWKMVEPIIAKIEKHQLEFGNSPYANIGDTSSLHFSLMCLANICKRNFAFMSLHKKQTVYLQNLIANRQHSSDLLTKMQLADLTLDVFSNNKLKGRSFAFGDNRIITPQEYLLLLRKQNGEN